MCSLYLHIYVKERLDIVPTISETSLKVFSNYIYIYVVYICLFVSIERPFDRIRVFISTCVIGDECKKMPWFK